MFSNMLEWLKANPEMATLLLGIAAGLFNYVTKPRTSEELEKLHPRVAAFFRFMNAMFPDPQKAIEAIWQAWRSTHDRLPTKKTSKE